jgi:hypothetical protein
MYDVLKQTRFLPLKVLSFVLIFGFSFYPEQALSKRSGYGRKELTGYVLRYKNNIVFTEEPDSTFTVYSVDFRDPQDKQLSFCSYTNYRRCEKKTITFSQIIKVRDQYQLTDVVLK